MGRLFYPTRSGLWPIPALGGVLGLTFFGDVLIFGTGRATPPDGYLFGSITAFACVIGVLYGSHWIATSDLSANRYPRLVRWCLGGSVVFVILNVGFMWSVGIETQLRALSWIRWAIATGGAAGLLIDIFEARAITREIDTEQARTRREELERERDRLEEFARIVSHDVRSPLSVANGHLELARDEYGDDEHLRSIDDALDRIEEIIEETLTLARQGKTVDQTTPVDISDIARTCWRTVSTKRADLAIESSGTIHADRDRLRHVFENLFRNAVEHAGEAVTIRVGMLDGVDGFYVEDDGPGIPESNRQDALTIGYTSADSGTGIGLVIVDQIIEAHGWKLRIREGTSGGARFEITGVDVVGP